MIFLVGARRSGTNWLFQNLIRHGSIVGIPPETYLFPLGIAPLAERFHHGAPSSQQTGAMYLPRDVMLDAFRDFADTAFAEVARRLDPRVDRILERTPANAIHMQLLRDVYPDAYYVHIIRDGRDASASLATRAFGPNSMREAAEEWRASIVGARTASAANYREIRYETLLKQPSEEMRALYEWLGLQVDAELLEEIATEAGTPVNVDPADAHITEGKWRSGLTEQDLVDFELVAGPLNRELGYPDIRPAASGRRRRSGRRLVDAIRHSRSAAVARLRPTPAKHSGASGAPNYWSLTRLADQFVEAIEGAGQTSLQDLLATDAAVLVVTRQGRDRVRGQDGLAKLAHELRCHASLLRHQVHSDVFPHYPSGISVALGYQVGMATLSLFAVLQVRSGPSLSIGRMTIYLAAARSS